MFDADRPSLSSWFALRAGPIALFDQALATCGRILSILRFHLGRRATIGIMESLRARVEHVGAFDILCGRFARSGSLRCFCKAAFPGRIIDDDARLYVVAIHIETDGCARIIDREGLDLNATRDQFIITEIGCHAHEDMFVVFGSRVLFVKIVANLLFERAHHLLVELFGACYQVARVDRFVAQGIGDEM